MRNGYENVIYVGYKEQPKFTNLALYTSAIPPRDKINMSADRGQRTISEKRVSQFTIIRLDNKNLRFFKK